jgi:hypothetical protein
MSIKILQSKILHIEGVVEGVLNRVIWRQRSSLLKVEIFSFLLKKSLLLQENYENGYKIMCLNAHDWQLDVKNVQEFLKQSRYWGS